MNNYNCIVVLGPTASGKTKFAVNLASHIKGEIISADSRQVYTGLNIGTGKDLEEYSIKGNKIIHHVIDICEPTQQFYLNDFIRELKNSFETIQAKHKWPIICGGSGLYLDALNKDFSFTQIPENESLRKHFSEFNKEGLQNQLLKYPPELVSHVDRNSVKRLLRGIEIAEYRLQHPEFIIQKIPYKPLYLGIACELEERRERITQRLKNRMEQGLIEETQGLLQSGLSHKRLQELGLEYKFISYYLLGNLNKDQLFTQLQTAIFQFAKRQMTWFRKMEKEGVTIHWFDRKSPVEKLIEQLGVFPKK